MIKGIISIIMSSLMLLSVGNTYGTEYSEYTEHQKESMSFEQWWRLFKKYAKDYGERVSETDRDYYRINYYEEGYFPDEAFDEEFN